MARSSLAPTASPGPERDQSGAPSGAAAPSGAEQTGSDRRVHKRLTPDQVSFVSKIRLKYGPAVKLVDLSTGGAQIETINFRLQPGSMVVVELASKEGELSMPAQVLRCQLASLLPEPVYRGSLIFKRRLEFKDLGSDPIEHPPVILNPALEHARLRQLLKRVIVDLPGSASENVPSQVYEALGAALATLESRAGRRAGSGLAADLAALFKAVSDLLFTAPPAAAVVTTVEDQLCRFVPASSIRLGENESYRQPPGSEPVFFAVPTLDPATPGARIVVEFAEGGELVDAHLQILKAGVQLIAIGRELARLNGADRPLKLRPEQRLPSGWSRIVIRYRNGQMLKGFTHDFVPTKGFVNVSPAPAVAAEPRTAVPFTEVKAIFFVRDHEGNAAYSESKEIDPSLPGRHVAVSFTDHEEMVGTTDNYSSSAPGFYLRPADRESNNDRVFIVGASVQNVKFL